MAVAVQGVGGDEPLPDIPVGGRVRPSPPGRARARAGESRREKFKNSNRKYTRKFVIIVTLLQFLKSI